MNLNLEQRFTPEELNEIRKRVFSFADQMLLQGISIGRELNREEIQPNTEQFMRDKLSAMTSYFVRDDLWLSMPPMGYNPNPAVDIPKPSADLLAMYGKAIKMAENPNAVLDSAENDMHPKDREFPEKPEWAVEAENKYKPKDQ